MIICLRHLTLGLFNVYTLINTYIFALKLSTEVSIVCCFVYMQNLKKSWHPQTLRNVEKVWKAEQKAEAETKKIDQLRRELDEEREREEMQRYAIDQGMAKCVT